MMDTQDEGQTGTTVCLALAEGVTLGLQFRKGDTGQNAPNFRDCHPLLLSHSTTPQTCPFVFVHKTVLELIVAE